LILFITYFANITNYLNSKIFINDDGLLNLQSRVILFYVMIWLTSGHKDFYGILEVAESFLWRGLYHKEAKMIPYPLTRAHRLRLAQVFAQVPRVDISIECVVEDQMGKAFVDSVENPQAFMIEQDQFFCYLAGNLTDDFLNKMPHDRFLMAGSDGWQKSIERVFGEQVNAIDRYGYSSDALSLEHLKRLASANAHTPNIQRADLNIARMERSFISLGAFDSAEDFVERGIGYCLLKDGEMIGAAYSSLVCGDAIEVSIFVDPEYHRQGIATALSCQLLLWCLEHHLAPHWDAANAESCNLAEKLGYQKAGQYIAYYLK
jgi:GNAT superfamily N-acetyltransferase